MLSAYRLLLLVLCTILLSPPAIGQSSYDLFGNARSDALAHSTTALASAAGVHANPASRATLSAPTALFYARQGFGLSVLRYAATSVTIPSRWGAASVGASTFGFEDYREIHINAGYARSFRFGTTRAVHLGALGRYYHTSIAEYRHAGTVGLNVGLLVPLLRSLSLGAHATNITGTILVDGEPIPQTLSVGLHYEAVEHVQILTDVFKDVRFPAAIRGGVEVRPVDFLAVRAGVATVPIRFMGGTGVRLGPLAADIAAEQHQRLGWTPSASLRVQW